MVKAFLLMPMEIYIMETGFSIRSMVKECSNLKKETSMMEIGVKDINMEKVFKHMLMVIHIMVNGSRIKDMVKVYSNGSMVMCMMVTG